MEIRLGSRITEPGNKKYFKKHVWQGFSSFLHSFIKNAKILVQLALHSISSSIKLSLLLLINFRWHSSI